MEFQTIGKLLMGIGIFIFMMGLALHFLPRVPYLGRLPGDILIKREHFTFYFPLTTCLIISLLLMLLSRFFGHK
jgi:hypothetical protein